MTPFISSPIMGYLVQHGYHPRELRSMQLAEIIDVYTWLVAGEIMSV